MSEIAATKESAYTGNVETNWTIERINTYFLDLERFLDKVERSTTHYEVLAVERSALHEQIKHSYQEAVSLLFPPYNISADLPDPMIERVERCFNKISLAFLTLASFRPRKQYDAALNSIAGKSSGDSFKVSSHAISPGAPATLARTEAEIKISSPAQREVRKEFTKAESGSNRRRCERFRLSVPVQVIGFDRKHGKWYEMAETIDVSRTGITLRLRKNVRYGTVFYISLPLPAKLRSHGYSDPSFKAYALVRRVEPLKKGTRIVALEFLGEHPPVGFLDKPWAIFRTNKWSGSERRRAPRITRLESVIVEYLTESNNFIMREEAKTENISRSGLRVMVTTAPPDFDLVRIVCPRRNFESLATVRNRYMAKDGIERICIQFIEKQWPF